MRLTQLGTPTLASILVFSLSAVGATPALAQTGQSQASVYDGAGSGYVCNQSSTGAATSANCPPTPITSGLGSATSAQDGLARTLSSNATLNQTGTGMYALSDAYSIQSNQFTVLGTSGSSDHLLFHFLTDGPYATVAGVGVGHNSHAKGDIVLTTSTGTAYDLVAIYGNGDPVNQSSGIWTVGAGFLDFQLPFSLFTGVYIYNWNGLGEAYAGGQPQENLSLSGGFSGMLDAIYATNAQGQTYGTVDFNTAQLDLTSSVPEPASLALLGTGLFGLVPMMRRKLRK